MAKYVGDDVDEIEEYYEFGNCSLVKATYRVLEKFRTENKVYAKITYPERAEQPMYDYNAVREVIINAIVHNLSEASDNLCYEKKNIMRSWTNKFFFYGLF